MGNRLGADLVLVVHLAFIVFVVVGGFVAWRWRWVAWLHLPAVAYSVIISLADLPCPLTPLEKRLRRQAGEEGYEGSFIEHYLVELIYPPGMTSAIRFAIGASLVVLWLAAYGGWWLRVLRHNG